MKPPAFGTLLGSGKDDIFVVTLLKIDLPTSFDITPVPSACGPGRKPAAMDSGSTEKKISRTKLGTKSSLPLIRLFNAILDSTKLFSIGGAITRASPSGSTYLYGLFWTYAYLFQL